MLNSTLNKLGYLKEIGILTYINRDSHQVTKEKKWIRFKSVPLGRNAGTLLLHLGNSGGQLLQF